SRFDITTAKSGGRLTVTSKDLKRIIDEVNDEDGIVIFPHCNSDNGLFQERTSTDRTLLADLFNHQKKNLLQMQHWEGADGLKRYILGSEHLTADFSCHISSDSRALRDVGRPDNKGNYLWIKADPIFEGLKQIIYEPDRIHVGPEKPERKKSYFVI